MLGPEGAAEALTALLVRDLPAKVDELGRRLNATRLARVDRELLVPKTIEAFEVIDVAVDTMPAFLVVAQGMTRMRRVDLGTGDTYAGQSVYRVRYKLRVFTWARGRSGVDDPAKRGAQADVNRKRLTLAVREVLLAGQELTVTIGDTPELDPEEEGYRAGTTVTGAIDETTITEALSDIVDDGAATVAAAYTELDIELDEAIPLTTPAPEAETVTTDVVPHPALA